MADRFFTVMGRLSLVTNDILKLSGPHLSTWHLYGSERTVSVTFLSSQIVTATLLFVPIDNSSPSFLPPSLILISQYHYNDLLLTVL
jgi:hypothetical protein